MAARLNCAALHHRPLDADKRKVGRRELRRTDAAIQKTIGRSSGPYFRPAFGDRDGRVLRAAAAAGWQCVMWTLDSHDAVGQPKTPVGVANRILSGPRRGDPRHFLDGAIVLFHAGKPTTARAMWRILDGLAEMQLQPVRLTTLLDPGDLPIENAER